MIPSEMSTWCVIACYARYFTKFNLRDSNERIEQQRPMADNANDIGASTALLSHQIADLEAGLTTLISLTQYLYIS